MLKIYNTLENCSNTIELQSIEIIENKLNTFFDSCIKNSSTYTFMLSENAGYYSKDNFEKMVLSSAEIENLITNILFEINNNFHQNIKFLNLNNNIEFNPVLITSIKEYNHSLKIITHCENVINQTVAKALDLKLSNGVMSHILKGENIGAFILGNNNHANMKYKYNKEIFNQIEGILLNTKCKIKNQLINYIITTLRVDDLKGELEFIITG